MAKISCTIRFERPRFVDIEAMHTALSALPDYEFGGRVSGGFHFTTSAKMLDVMSWLDAEQFKDEDFESINFTTAAR